MKRNCWAVFFPAKKNTPLSRKNYPWPSYICIEKFMDKNNFYNNDFFPKILSGNATKQEQAVFEQWLSMPGVDRSGFDAYKKLWESLGYIKGHDIDAAKLKTRIKILEKQKQQKSFYYYWQKIAAVLLVPVLLASLFLYFDKWGATGNSSATVETVRTPCGARTSLTLPDGSIAWLNAGSEISFPHEFNDVREVGLKGEMYLEVKKSKAPFIVKTQYGNVKVLGTKFNVSAYDDDCFTTTLIEGSVSLTGRGVEKEFLLSPGFQAILKNGGYEASKVDAASYVSWKDGRMEFRREPFGQVAKKLERWFNVSIELKGEEIKKLWYTGTIEMESFSEVLELIKNTTPIEYSFDPKNRILTIESKI